MQDFQPCVHVYVLNSSVGRNANLHPMLLALNRKGRIIKNLNAHALLSAVCHRHSQIAQLLKSCSGNSNEKRGKVYTYVDAVKFKLEGHCVGALQMRVSLMNGHIIILQRHINKAEK